MAQPNPRPRNPMMFDPEKGMTRQEFTRECDINVIMAKYQKTGVVNHVRTHGLEYGDYDAIDFQQAMDTIKRGEEMFADLPSKARKYFDNDPAAFMAYVNDPDNADSLGELAVELGLAKPRPTPETDSAPQTPSEGAEGTES